MPPILEVKDLHVRFPVFGGVLLRKTGEVRAVNGVSFALQQGETLGLVGESGSGKTTVGPRDRQHPARDELQRRDLRARSSTTTPSGVVESRAARPKREMRPYRTDIQMIFQDPYSSLNPRMTVGQIVEEPLKIHTKQIAGRAAGARAVAAGEGRPVAATTSTAIRTSSPAGSGSASASRARWRRIRRS